MKIAPPIIDSLSEGEIHAYLVFLDARCKGAGKEWSEKILGAKNARQALADQLDRLIKHAAAAGVSTDVELPLRPLKGDQTASPSPQPAAADQPTSPQEKSEKEPLQATVERTVKEVLAKALADTQKSSAATQPAAATPQTQTATAASSSSLTQQQTNWIIGGLIIALVAAFLFTFRSSLFPPGQGKTGQSPTSEYGEFEPPLHFNVESNQKGE